MDEYKLMYKVLLDSDLEILETLKKCCETIIASHQAAEEIFMDGGENIEIVDSDEEVDKES